MANQHPASQASLDITNQLERRFDQLDNRFDKMERNLNEGATTESSGATVGSSQPFGRGTNASDSQAGASVNGAANSAGAQAVAFKDNVVNSKDLANARTTPSQPAATGQPLTHYHSLFHRLLSWKSPRATGIVFASLVTLIFASRYISFARYAFKGIWTVLGLTATAEIVGKAAFGNGFATQLRPRKYYTIRKESLERFLDDVEQLINFGVIEAQRILFVENIWVTGLAFAASFLSYFLIKLLPLWGLTLLATSVTFLAPLIYISNKELIDEQLNHAGQVISSQAGQVRDIAAQNANQASSSIRSYAGDYSQKAQELIGNARGKVNSTANGVGSSANTSSTTGASTQGTTTKPVGNTAPPAPATTIKAPGSAGTPTQATTIQSPDFPTAPRTEPVPSKPITTTSNEPIAY